MPHKPVDEKKGKKPSPLVPMCSKSLDGQCKHGGGKYYNFGFVSGSAEYCRYQKAWVNTMKSCPIGRDKP